jgi:hypothetical protein
MGKVEDLYHPVSDGPGFIGAMGQLTTFGGPSDSQDSGGTACGFSTLDHSDYPYCALPIPVWKKYKLRCGMAVRFEHGGKSAVGILLDKGPSARLMRVADVSPVIMAALGGDGLLDNVRVTFKP